MGKTVDELVGDVRTMTTASTSVVPDSSLRGSVIGVAASLFPDSSAAQTDFTDEYDTDMGLSLSQERAVVLSTAVEMCYTLGFRYATAFEMESPLAKTNQQQVVDNYLKLAKALKEELKDTLTSAGIDPTTALREVKLVINNQFTGATPNEDSIVPPAVTDLAATVVGNQVQFTWSEPSMSAFGSYGLIRNTEEGLYNKSYSNNAHAGVPGAIPNTVRVWTGNRKWRCGTVVESHPTGTYYYALVVFNRGGKTSFSNEVEVTV